MKAKELKEKTTDELVALEAELRDDLFRLRMRHYSGQLQKVSDMRTKRRDIARVQTILNQREG